MVKVRGLRGATTADTNTRESLLEATRELLIKMTEENQVDTQDIAAVFFTTTPDLNAEFPALAARKIGWEHVPLLGASEVGIPGAVGLCIRVLILMNTEKDQRELSHIYLKGAKNLRARGTEDQVFS